MSDSTLPPSPAGLLANKFRRIFQARFVVSDCESRPLNNVILRSGNTSASKDFHFPEVEATVPVHLFNCAAPLDQKCRK